MKKHCFAHSLAVGALLLLPTVLVARDHKPCRELENDLNNQVNTLHRLQDRELAQCHQANGKSSDVCRDLKNQHALALRQMRNQRHAQLDICDPRANQFGIQAGTNNSCDRANYQRTKNDCYPGKKCPDNPYKHPPKDQPPVAHKPPKHDGGGGGKRTDGDAGDTRSAGNSGSSHHHSDHSSGSSSSSSGGSSGTSARSNTSSGSGSSGSSSSGLSSSSSNSTASSNSSPSSGSSFNASSSAIQSSAPSHSNSGASRPK